MARIARKVDEEDGPMSERHGYWRTILDEVEQPIIVASASGVIVEFNTAAEQLTGYPAAEVVERLPLTVLYDSGQIVARARALSVQRGEWLEPSFDTLLAAGTQALPEREWMLVCKDGRRLTVSVGWRALRGALGTLEGWLVLPRELAPARWAPQRAEAAPSNAAPREPCDAHAPPEAFAPGDALRRLNGDRALLAEIAGLFQSECVKLGADIQRAVQDRDATAVQRGAHRLRSALLNLAAAPAAEAALRLEDSGRRGCLPQPEQLAILFAELDRLAEALSSFRGASP